MLSGQTLAVPKLLFLEEHDFVSFIRGCVQNYYIHERHERVSYFAIVITLDGFLKRRLASVNGYFVSVTMGFNGNYIVNEFCIAFLDLIRFDRICVSLCILLWGWRVQSFPRPWGSRDQQVMGSSGESNRNARHSGPQLSR